MALYLKYARPAFSIGLSIRPPPATIPTIARLLEAMVFFEPEGNLTFDLYNELSMSVVTENKSNRVRAVEEEKTRPDTWYKMRLVCVFFSFENNAGHTDGHDLI